MPKLKKHIGYVYDVMEEDIEMQIRNGTLKPGECILSENELSRHYGVSRRSSRKALDNLVAKGLLYRHAGKGTFVAEHLPAGVGTPRRRVISLIVPDIDDAFIAEIGKGVQESADGICDLVIQSSNGNADTENSNIQLLLEKHFDGAIIFPNWGRTNIDVLFRLKQAGVPFVLVDRYFRDVTTDCVMVNNRAGGCNATRYLVSLGHRRIAHLHGTDCSANRDRFEGYRDALAEAGIVYNPLYVRYIDTASRELQAERFEPDKCGGYAGMKSLLALPERPTAVFAGNDYQAIGALIAIEESGLKVPEDISVIGFDDLKISTYLEKPLTTIRQPQKAIGHNAFELLMRRLDGDNAPPQHTMLDTELVIRKTCGAAPTAIRDSK